MAPKPRWSIWISPRPSIALIIGSWQLFWQLFWRLPDSNRSSENRLVWCTTTRWQWCRWTGSAVRLSQSSVRSGRVAPSLFFMSSLWSPSSISLEMKRQVRPSAVYVLQALFRQTYADDITVFVFHRLKKAVASYEQITGARINYKSEGLR